MNLSITSNTSLRDTGLMDLSIDPTQANCDGFTDTETYSSFQDARLPTLLSNNSLIKQGFTAGDQVRVGQFSREVIDLNADIPNETKAELARLLYSYAENDAADTSMLDSFPVLITISDDKALSNSFTDEELQNMVNMVQLDWGMGASNETDFVGPATWTALENALTRLYPETSQQENKED